MQENIFEDVMRKMSWQMEVYFQINCKVRRKDKMIFDKFFFVYNIVGVWVGVEEKFYFVRYLLEGCSKVGVGNGIQSGFLLYIGYIRY